MIKSRKYIKEDAIKVCEFLGKLYQLNNKSQHSWLPFRWDYMVYLLTPAFTLGGYKKLEDTTFLWETEEGEIIGMINSEEPKQAHIQIHPNFRYIEEEMISWAENNIALLDNDKNIKSIIIWATDDDYYRHKLLEKCVYKRSVEYYEYQLCQNLNNKVIPEPKLPEGYSIHSLEEGIDILKRCELEGKVFTRYSLPEEIYLNLKKSSLYRFNLDLVTMLGDGTITSFCTIWYDEMNHIAKFEPVGTHPDHRKKGLGSAMLLDGLKRLKNLGVETAYVDAGSEDNLNFYRSAGFNPININRPWYKEF
ncbi:MAG TPA: GNAT family N-acetyltransferase [Clostridiaceae bacterium]